MEFEFVVVDSLVPVSGDIVMMHVADIKGRRKIL